LSAPDLLNDVAANLAPIVYTWAEPRVGHPDFVHFFDTRVNICYRIANLWDVVPQSPATPGSLRTRRLFLHIDSGFTLDIVHNHVLISGYAPGMVKWNQNHPGPGGPLVGKTV